jgi:TatD DNase family protein
MLIDTHCHLDFPDFDRDRGAVLKSARRAQVRAVINVGADLTSSRRGLALARAEEGVFASVGIHPHEAKGSCPEALEEIRALLADPKVVAVGEVGLDLYRNLSPPEVQEKVFRNFIDLAAEARRPLIVHSRAAADRTLEILKEQAAGRVPGVVFHCFSQDEPFLRRCLDAGFFVSFTANILYPSAEGLRMLARVVPSDRFFLETDAPFLAPSSQRGRRNEPAYLVELAQEIARLRGSDFDTVCAQTTENAIKFFGLQVDF